MQLYKKLRLASFKIISTLSFPTVPTQFITPILHVYQSPNHDPIVLFTYPNSTIITIFNVIHLEPRKPPPFPLDEAGLVESAQRMHLVDQVANDIQDRGMPTEISGWEIRTAETNHESEKLMACAMGRDGEMIIGVGVKGSIWVWSVKGLII